MSRFYEIEPTLENYWRAIILFGKNTATYKFSLAKALIELSNTGKSNFSLDEVAHHYSLHLCNHLKDHPKQITSNKSSFLEMLKSYNKGDIKYDEMINQSVKNGFNNVIDAFHYVHDGEIKSRFFIDHRKINGGIKLTDDFYKLIELDQFGNLYQEVESRWNLVESAWENNLSKNIMLVEYNHIDKILMGVNSIRRTNVTSARSALNGYQKGRCFYCYKEISIVEGSDQLADVDHFFPHLLKHCDHQKPIDGISNLVLSCKDCNRGEDGKFSSLPSVSLLERLFNRNEYFITSHNPLRETIISQTGNTTQKRQSYLQDAYNCASLFLGSHKKWHPIAHGSSVF